MLAPELRPLRKLILTTCRVELLAHLQEFRLEFLLLGLVS